MPTCQTPLITGSCPHPETTRCQAPLMGRLRGQDCGLALCAGHARRHGTAILCPVHHAAALARPTCESCGRPVASRTDVPERGSWRDGIPGLCFRAVGGNEAIGECDALAVAVELAAG